MPKARKTRSDTSPTTYYQPLPTKELKLEWDGAICPICMEPPHNAVLLRCSSWGNGCRPYICNTGARHSDCLEQFYISNSRAVHEQAVDIRKSCTEFNVKCPFCRGRVVGWQVVQPARKHMNSKPRGCSSKSCEFSGTYSEIRKHVRSEHPYERPREVDILSQEKWAMSELQRYVADLESVALPVEEEEEEDMVEMLASRSATSLREQLSLSAANLREQLHLSASSLREQLNLSATSLWEQFPYVVRVEDGRLVLYHRTQLRSISTIHDSSLDIPMQHSSQRGAANNAEVQGDTSSSTAAASVVSATRGYDEGSNQTSRPGTSRHSSAHRSTPYRRTRRRNQ